MKYQMPDYKMNILCTYSHCNLLQWWLKQNIHMRLARCTQKVADLWHTCKEM